MIPSPKPNEKVDLKKMIADIDSRFVSGNDIPVERAAVRAFEWNELKRLLEKLKEIK